jgi:iron complex outermembrane recepter protein
MNIKKAIASLTILAGATGVCASAWSQAVPQTAPASPPAQLDEIVITAQRRAETVQQSSLAISVLQGPELAKITQPKDITLAVPGVQVGAGNPIPQVYIRGVGDYGANALSNPAVAMNVDGVYLGRPTAISGQFFDLERAEILKGPQGTLYGRNASGGALNLLTKRPDFAGDSGFLEAEAGNYALYRASGALNAPLSSTVAVRGAFQVARRDGYLSDGSNDDKHESGRLRMLWQPNDDLSLLLGTDYTHLGGHGNSLAVMTLPGRSPWTGEADPVSAAFLQSHQPFPHAFFPITPSDTRQDMKIWGVNAELNWQLGFATLTVLPVYRYTRLNYQTLPGGFIFGEDSETSNQKSLEVRLSNNSDFIKWVAGLYYFNENQFQAALVPVGVIQNYTYAEYPQTKSYAGFGQATMSITPVFRAISGIRYTEDDRGLDGHTFAETPDASFSGPSAFARAGACYQLPSPCIIDTFHGSVSTRKVNWKAGIEYDPASEHMVYLTGSTGFKAGGLNQNSSSSPPGTTQAEIYRPEQLLAFELGSRNRFLDDRLQVNLEAFHWRYRDHQEPRVAATSLGIVAFSFSNAGVATIEGLDLDIVAKPTNDDAIRLVAEYAGSRYDQFVYSQPVIPFKVPAPVQGVGTGCAVSVAPAVPHAVATVDCSGFQLAHTPKWSGSFGYNHRFELANGASVVPSVDMQFASQRWIQIEFTPIERAPSYSVLDADLTYQSPRNHWSVTAYGENLTNRAVYTSGARDPFTTAPYFAGSIQNPRIYGAKFKVNF